MVIGIPVYVGRKVRNLQKYEWGHFSLDFYFFVLVQLHCEEGFYTVYLTWINIYIYISSGSLTEPDFQVSMILNKH